MAISVPPRPRACHGSFRAATLLGGIVVVGAVPLKGQVLAGLPPTGVTAVATSSFTVTVTWKPVAGALSYDVGRNCFVSSPPSNCARTSGTITGTVWKDSGLTPDMLYTYDVSAKYTMRRPGVARVVIRTPAAQPLTTAAPTSPTAPTATADRLAPCLVQTTGGPAPVNLRFVESTPVGASIVWDPVGGTTNYVVERSRRNTWEYGVGGVPDNDWVFIGSTCTGAVGGSSTFRLLHDRTGGLISSWDGRPFQSPVVSDFDSLQRLGGFRVPTWLLHLLGDRQ